MIIDTNEAVAEANPGHPVTHTILLAAYHGGEFRFPDGIGQRGGDWVRAFQVWDGYNATSIINDLVDQGTWREHEPELTKAFDILFPTVREKYSNVNPYANYNDVEDPTQFSLYYVSCGIKGHAAVFDELCKGARDEISGDDTVFDYWPSEFGALVDYAYDIDAIMGGSLFLDNARAVWDLQNDRQEDKTFLESEVTPRP